MHGVLVSAATLYTPTFLRVVLGGLAKNSKKKVGVSVAYQYSSGQAAEQFLGERFYQKKRFQICSDTTLHDMIPSNTPSPAYHPIGFNSRP